MQATQSDKCVDRIAGQLKDRETYFKDLQNRANDGDDSAVDDIYSTALCVETVQETTITLSWGGPADYLHIKHHDDEVLGVTYRFSDWFDTATDELDETSPLWDYAVQIVEALQD